MHIVAQLSIFPIRPKPIAQVGLQIIEGTLGEIE